jgi:plasmid stability protein
MASLTLKNIPDELLERLRLVAEWERRSITQQVLYILERSLTEESGGRVEAEPDGVVTERDSKEAP